MYKQRVEIILKLITSLRAEVELLAEESLHFAKNEFAEKSKQLTTLLSEYEKMLNKEN